MRYISPFHRLTMYRKNGKVAHVFKNGELIVGDATTTNGTNVSTNATAYTVDAYKYASDLPYELHMPFKVDLAGAPYATGNLFELVGEGYLDGKAGTYTKLEDGWQGRLFFKAPYITATSTPVAGAWYKVHSGTVTYDGVTYKGGKSFKALSTRGDIEVVGSAIYSLELPIEMRSKCCDALNEQFKIKHLEYGDEPYSYFLWDSPSGFGPRNSLLTTDADFIGYSR